MTKTSLSKGKLSCSLKELNLKLTLLGGQSFRWKVNKDESLFSGVALNHYWELKQTDDYIEWEAFGEKKDNFHEILVKYFRLDFNLSKNVEIWKRAHPHFKENSKYLKSVRVLDQEPLENLISFICSQNNHINRISTMVEWLCSQYGEKICSRNDVDYYAFPTLESFVKHQDTLEGDLRKAKFGYRAKFISASIKRLQEFGGLKWFEKLKDMPYKEARQELVRLPGIGLKVADCICLMSLGHLEAVPIDTHIFQIAQKYYMPEELVKIKSVTPKTYEAIADKFKLVYGEYAGWTQAILFCAQLSKFNKEEEKPVKRRKC